MRAARNQRSFVRLSVVHALLLGQPRNGLPLYCRSDRMVDGAWWMVHGAWWAQSIRRSQYIGNRFGSEHR